MSVCFRSTCCFKVSHDSLRQADYRCTCKFAESKYNTTIDKDQNHLRRSKVCLGGLPRASWRASCCATPFRELPQHPANFCDFLRISATFRDFPRVSADFLTQLFSAQFSKFPRLSANSRSAMCSKWALSHCAAEIMVLSRVNVMTVVLPRGSFHSGRADNECNVNKRRSAWPQSNLFWDCCNAGGWAVNGERAWSSEHRRMDPAVRGRFAPGLVFVVSRTECSPFLSETFGPSPFLTLSYSSSLSPLLWRFCSFRGTQPFKDNEILAMASWRLCYFLFRMFECFQASFGTFSVSFHRNLKCVHFSSVISLVSPLCLCSSPVRGIFGHTFEASWAVFGLFLGIFDMFGHF